MLKAAAMTFWVASSLGSGMASGVRVERAMLKLKTKATVRVQNSEWKAGAWLGIGGIVRTR